MPKRRPEGRRKANWQRTCWCPAVIGHGGRHPCAPGYAWRWVRTPFQRRVAASSPPTPRHVYVPCGTAGEGGAGHRSLPSDQLGETRPANGARAQVRLATRPPRSSHSLRGNWGGRNDPLRLRGPKSSQRLCGRRTGVQSAHRGARAISSAFETQVLQSPS